MHISYFVGFAHSANCWHDYETLLRRARLETWSHSSKSSPHTHKHTHSFSIDEPTPHAIDLRMKSLANCFAYTSFTVCCTRQMQTDKHDTECTSVAVCIVLIWECSAHVCTTIEILMKIEYIFWLKIKLEVDSFLTLHIINWIKNCREHGRDGQLNLPRGCTSWQDDGQSSYNPPNQASTKITHEPTLD